MIPRMGAPHAWPSSPPDSYDCWTAVAATRAWLGLTATIEINPAEYSPRTLPQAVSEELCSGRWCEVTQPIAGDVYLFDTIGSHCGVFTSPSYVLHCSEGLGVAINRWAVIRRRYPHGRIMRR